MNDDKVGVPTSCEMQLYSGKFMNPLKPKVSDIDIRDIAAALSKLCRFGGHVSRFYSVAQHSVLVSYNVTPGDELEGLMHDSAEGLGLGDLIRPVKIQLGIGPVYKKAETRTEKVVAERFGLKFPWPISVKIADNRVVLTEMRDLKPKSERRLIGAGDFKLLKKVIKPWGPAKAERKFLERYYQLEAQRSK
jgi:hypothetical protein